MADDEQRLVIAIEARTAEMERSFKKLTGMSAASFKKMKADAAGFGAKLDALTAKMAATAISSGKALLSGLAGGLAGGLAIGSIASIPTLLDQVTGSLDDLQTQADKLALPVEELQRWQFAAAETDVTNEQLEGAFTALTRKIGEAARETDGAAAKAFGRLGINVISASGDIKSMTQIMFELSSAIQNLPTQEQRFAAMFSLAKENGAELIRLLGDGPDAIRDMMRRADELGVVIDGELVQRGADLNRQFEIVAETVSTKLKVAIVEAALALQQFMSIWPEGGFSMGLASGPTTPGGKVGAAFGQQLKARADAAKGLGAVLGSQKGDMLTFGDWADVRSSASSDQAARLAKLAAEQKAAADAKAYNAYENRRTAAFQNQAGLGTAAHEAQVKAEKEAEKLFARAAKARDPYDEQLKRLEQNTAAMQAYGDMLIRYNGNAERAQVATDLLSAAFEKGAEVTPEMQGAVDALSARFDAARQRADDLYNANQRMLDMFADMNETGKDALSGFISDLRQGKGAAEALSNVLNRLADKALDSALDGLFNIGGEKNGGLFGTLFGSFFRDGGGRVNAGQPYIVGEKRAEIFVPDTSGSVRRTGDAGAASTMAARPAPQIIIQGDASEKTVGLISAALREYDAVTSYRNANAWRGN